ncbi:MAG: hypothetical protein LUH55_14645, partial [Bacteroides thetaiotaomicron]|nr:hypothetical protein [Bacteroides thetaiotaomicron]
DYDVTITLNGSGIDEDESAVTQTWTTLKRTPTLGAASINVNTSGYFELGVTVESDPDSAIAYYNYEIRDSSANVVKTLTNVSANSNVTVYLEDGVIERGEYYYVVATAVYYDNEKYLEVSTDASDSARIVDEGSSLIYFVHYGTNSDGSVNENETETYDRSARIRGTLHIVKNNISSIDLSTTDKYLTLRFESTSSADYSRTIKIDASEVTMDTTENELVIPVDFLALPQDTTFRIAVWGWVTTTSGSDSQSTYTLLGNYTLTTSAYASATAISLTTVSSDATIVAAIEITTLSDSDDAAESVGMFTSLVVSLYNGSSSAGTLLGTKTFSDSDTSYYSSSFAQYLDSTDSDNQLVVTNLDFNIPNYGLTGSQYWMEVAAVYDYTATYNYTDGENLTGYVNEIPFESTGRLITVNNAMPNLPSPYNEAVTATPIYNSDLEGSEYEQVSKQDDLEDDTIVGYILQAEYNNEMDYGRTLYYYGFLASKFNSFSRDEGYNTPADQGLHTFAYPVSFVSGSNSAPALRVLFLDSPEDATTVSVTSMGSRTEADWEVIEGVQGSGTAGSSGFQPYETQCGGDTTVFVGRENLPSSRESLGRGYHYIFAYKARLEIDGDSGVIYPDDYTLETVGGTQRMLCSQVADTPRQNTQVKMYLDELTSGGRQAVWKLKVDSDPDGAWESGFTGADPSGGYDYTNGLRVDGSSISGTHGISVTGPSNDWYTVNANMYPGNGSVSDVVNYNIGMYQVLYANDDDYLSVDSANQTLASHYFTKPVNDWWEEDSEGNTILGTDEGVTVSAEYPNTSNTVTFTFSSTTSYYISRIARMVIGVYDYSDEDYPMVYRYSRSIPGQTSSSGNYTREVEIDLTSIPENYRSKKLAFKVQILYDTGDVGLHWLEDEEFSCTMPSGDSSRDSTNDIVSDEISNIYVARVTNLQAYLNYYYTYNTTTEFATAHENTNGYVYYGGYSISGVNSRPWDVDSDEAGVTVNLLNQIDWYSRNDTYVLDPYFEIPLYFGQNGSEYLPDSTAAGNGTQLVFSPLAKVIYPEQSAAGGDDNFIPIKLGDGTLSTTITADNLSPSITNPNI